MSFAAQDIFANRYKLLQRSSISDSIETWKAEDIKTKSSITLRFTNEAGNVVLNGLLLKEYLLLTQIRHHRLLMPLHFDEWENISYLVYPFPDGDSLKHNIHAEIFLNEEAGVKLFTALFEGVSALHAEGVFHRNIQPANIFLIKQQFIIGQFKRQNEITSGQQQELLPYSAPELFGEQPQYTAESDVFAIAVLVYYACTGILPWQGMGGLALLKGASIPKLPNTFSEKFSKLLIACMDINPEKRKAISNSFSTIGNYFEPEANATKVQGNITAVSPILEAPIIDENIQPEKKERKQNLLLYATVILLVFLSATMIILLQNNAAALKQNSVADNSKISIEIDTAQNNFTVTDTTISSIEKSKSEYNYRKRKLTPFRNEAGLYGYRIGSKKVVITPLFDDVFEFSENMAAVKMRDMWGYIDTAGSWVIKPQFTSAGTFNNGVATVQKDGSNFMINAEGTCVTGCSGISQQSF